MKKNMRIKCITPYATSFKLIKPLQQISKDTGRKINSVHLKFTCIQKILNAGGYVFSAYVCFNLIEASS